MKTTKQMQEEIWKKFPFIEMIEEYKGANEKIVLRCNNCGHEWKAVPRSVAMSKCGCPKCGVAEDKRQKSLKLFMSRIDLKLWDIIEFKNSSDITLKCKKCGNIRHTNANNIYKYGCKICSSRAEGEKRKLGVEEFIKKAKEVHGNKYDYSKVNYINYNTPVTIICPIHGEFQQSPSKHISGHNCPKCMGKEWTVDDFIKESKKIHGNKYDYSKVKFDLDSRSSTKVEIICPIHGPFWQLPYVHCKNGCGCPECKQSHGERLVASILKINNIKYIFQYPLKNPYEGRDFKLDFYIFYNKNKYVIEYNGRQHYEPVEIFGGKKAFDEQLLRDSDLRRYCKENNWNLLEIPFYNTEEEIIDSIQKFLNLPSIIKELNGQLQTENGEVCDDNPVLSSEIKEFEPVQSVEIEPEKSE